MESPKFRSASLALRAGHPHWQLDVLETLRNQHDELTELDPADVVEQFPGEPTLDVRSITLESIHFASAAAWWTGQPDCQMNAPTDDASLTRWARYCVRYMKQELRRCNLR
jgi:hypothetical protein